MAVLAGEVQRCEASVTERVHEAEGSQQDLDDVVAPVPSSLVQRRVAKLWERSNTTVNATSMVLTAAAQLHSFVQGSFACLVLCEESSAPQELPSFPGVAALGGSYQLLAQTHGGKEISPPAVSN